MKKSQTSCRDSLCSSPAYGAKITSCIKALEKTEVGARMEQKQYADLQRAIYRTIEDIELWQDVLSLISEITGITKGTIALRDRLTGGLVIPTEVWRGLEHPMLFGWTQEEVGSYINDYMGVDPWIELERLFHPSTPYILSKHLPVDSLRDSPFWEWLEPIGIADGVVAEIGTSSPYWVSMNLYCAEDNEFAKQTALALLNEFQPTMQHAWRLGQIARASRLDEPHLTYFLNQQDHPALLLDAEGSILLSNDKVEVIFGGSEIPVFRVNNKIKITNPRLREKYNQAMDDLRGKHMLEANFPELTFDDGGLHMTLALVGKTEDRMGADRAMRLATIRTQAEVEAEVIAPVWENPLLTKRERQLVRLLAEGARVVDYMNKYELKKSTSHFHWQNVKKKLDIKDRAEIVAKHQIYLQNL